MNNGIGTTFFLTGKPRIGKTTLIKNIVKELGPHLCGGFYTEEIRDISNRIGFKCVTLTGDSEEIASVQSSSSIRIGRYGIDIASFEKIALHALKNSLESKRIIVIDEVGFMQMLSTSFQEMVYNIVSKKHHIVLGTIPLHSHPRIDIIKRLPGIRIINVNEDNRDRATQIVVRDIFTALWTL